MRMKIRLQLPEVSTSRPIRLSNKVGCLKEADIYSNGKSKWPVDFVLMCCYELRRYAVLTKNHLCTFAQKGSLANPTETILMGSCSTVKSSDDEINKEYSFKLDIDATTFYFYAENYEEKEGWIGALGRAMIKPSVMIDSAFDNEYM